ncbi:MAG: succinylglutamate desuccinylase/aspartoacylase family protein [Thermoanaerobaculia bacterium]|nr:succinylglutamate desuccinylase/aspartoacylase family protein [Thermoanaerobaculia bacterium]
MSPLASTRMPSAHTPGTPAGASPSHAPSPSVIAVPRVLAHLLGSSEGPTLICVVGLHGNEPAGVFAVRQLLEKLESEPLPIKGQLLVLAGNRTALGLGRRFVDADLNRLWSEENVQRLREQGEGGNTEERELLELDLELQQAVATDQPVYLLDLHSTSGASPSFVVLEDCLRNRTFGLAFQVPLVLGIEEELDGTLYHYLSSRGVTGITLETGSHEDPGTVERARAALWIALETTGLLEEGNPHAAEGREMLRRDKGDLPDVVEVHYRHALDSTSEFAMEPGFAGFQAVSAGEQLATDGGCPIRASDAGYLLMPLYQPQGDDGFFLARAVNPSWLKLSATLRRRHIERFVHWLPGVHQVGSNPDRYRVDRGIARWFALEVFHLLGFHREGPAERNLLMVRRNDG